VVARKGVRKKGVEATDGRVRSSVERDEVIPVILKEGFDVRVPTVCENGTLVDAEGIEMCTNAKDGIIQALVKQVGAWRRNAEQPLPVTFWEEAVLETVGLSLDTDLLPKSSNGIADLFSLLILHYVE
jgi:hypothetical protein